MEIGWPSIAASASMPPTPQPSTERPLTMVVWLSVPTSVVGKGLRVAAIRLLGPHRLRQIFEIDLVADAGAGRHHAEIVEGARPPAQERVALAVALIFLVDIDLEGLVRAERVDHHRMVDDEIDRSERIDLLRVAAERCHRVAHGGEIDHGGHAGEVLHQHARRAEGDLAVALALLEPERHAANVVGGDGASILVAQQILEQHLEREGQIADADQPVGLGLLQAEIVVFLAVDFERAPAFEAVERGFKCRCQRDLHQEVITQRFKRMQGRGQPEQAGPPPARTPPLNQGLRDWPI